MPGRRLPQTEKLRDLCRRYTPEYCAELLDLDPSGCDRLLDIAHGMGPKRRVSPRAKTRLAQMIVQPINVF